MTGLSTVNGTSTNAQHKILLWSRFKVLGNQALGIHWDITLKAPGLDLVSMLPGCYGN